MTHHALELNRTTLHGHFSRDLPPVLTINSGDTVQYRLLDAGWGLEAPRLDGTERRKFEPRTKLDDGHALCGPVAIRGAQPGMTLQIDLKEIRPGAWGSTYAGGWPSDFNQRLGVAEEQNLMVWQLDAENLTGTNQHGQSLKLRPFLGVIGLPPDEPGTHSTASPRFCGGNLDCKELVAGSTLYLPIAVPLALVSVGDGHGIQGDGEVCGTAIECPMERVTITYTLRDDMPIEVPHARIPGAWLTLGIHETLDEATYIALDAMLKLMDKRYGLKRTDALALASLVVDMRITQIVNGVRGVHAVLRDGMIY